MTVSSNDPVARWERRWAESRLVRRVRPDGAVGRPRLQLAETNLERARRELSSGDADAGLIFAEAALINAADAVLAKDGFSAGSHVVRFGYPKLPTVYASESVLIDRIRSSRNTAQYEAAGKVDAKLSARAIDLAVKAIAAVRAHLTA